MRNCKLVKVLKQWCVIKKPWRGACYMGAPRVGDFALQSYQDAERYSCTVVFERPRNLHKARAARAASNLFSGTPIGRNASKLCCVYRRGWLYAWMTLKKGSSPCKSGTYRHALPLFFAMSRNSSSATIRIRYGRIRVSTHYNGVNIIVLFRATPVRSGTYGECW